MKFWTACRITAHVPTTEYKTKEAHYQYLIQFDPTNYDHDLPLSIKVWHMVNRDGHKLGLLQWPLDVHDKMIADVVMHTNPSHDVLAHCQDTCYEQIEHLLIDKKEWARRWKLCQFRCLMDKATGFTHLPCKKPE
ncbi:hypothetical protein APHAL10511_008141 [Amanita phalloides]|nr:hypothetical protein APHAL10511_008141 [Amanita phalloides]